MEVSREVSRGCVRFSEFCFAIGFLIFRKRSLFLVILLLLLGAPPEVGAKACTYCIPMSRRTILAGIMARRSVDMAVQCGSAFHVFMRRDTSVLNVRKTLSIKDPPTLYCPFSSSRNVLYLY